MATIKRIQCDFYCNGCQQEGAHELVYSNNVLIYAKCVNCGRVVPFSEKTLLTIYAKEMVQRILTKPQRLSQELKRDLRHAILSLPVRVITKPYRLVKEVEEVVDENKGQEKKPGKEWNKDISVEDVTEKEREARRKRKEGVEGMADFDEAIVKAVEFMAISARTAPKARGDDFVAIKILSGDAVANFADEMVRYGEETGRKNYDRDGENVRNSSAILLLSLDNPAPGGMNCGACGHNRCADLKTEKGAEFDGPLCAWRLLDLGIALGSAAKTASMFNLDNRIMYRIGSVAKKLGLIPGEMVVGIPVSVSGKNIYFDRK
jgi:uncharacterized ferredoxin-like protein